MEGGGKMPVARTGTLVMLGLMAMGGCAVAHAADAGDTLRVGISQFAPFVTRVILRHGAKNDFVPPITAQ
jgi:hypothetical protein